VTLSAYFEFPATLEGNFPEEIYGDGSINLITIHETIHRNKFHSFHFRDLSNHSGTNSAYG
jgi:hypothetical protein